MLMYAGSSEMIGLTLGIMKPRVDYTDNLLYDEFIALQGDDPVWTPHHETLSHYFTVLSSAGFVAKAAGEGPARLTLLGEEIGKALIGHLLKLSSEVEFGQAAFIGVSEDIQGEAQDHRRVIEDRLILLGALVKNRGKPLGGREYDRLLGPKAGASEILEALKTAGIISHESPRRTPVTKYLPGPHFSKLRVRDGNMLYHNAVLVVLQQAFNKEPTRPLANNEIIKLILGSGMRYEDLSDDELAAGISKVTARLRSRRHLNRLEVTPEEPGDIKVWLTPRQLTVAHRLVGIFEGLLRPTPSYLAVGRAALKEILHPKSRETVRALIGKSAPITAQSYQKTRNDLKNVADKDTPRPSTHEERLALAEQWSSGERYALLCRVVQSQISNPQDASDVLSEIFIQLMKSNFMVPFANEQNWVLTIAYRRIKTHYRKHYTAKDHQGEIDAIYEQEGIVPDAAEEAHDRVARQPLQELLVDAYGDARHILTPQQFSILQVELANPEITNIEGAAKLEITESAYRTARNRMRRKVQAFLAQRFEVAAAEGMYIPPEFLKHLSE